jgi:hypothetical protein
VVHRLHQSTGRNDNSTGRNMQSTGRNDNSTGRNMQSTGRNDNSTGRNMQSAGRNDNSTDRNEQSTGRNDNSTGRNEKSTGTNDKKTARMKFAPVQMTKKPRARNLHRYTKQIGKKSPILPLLPTATNTKYGICVNLCHYKNLSTNMFYIISPQFHTIGKSP